MLKFSDSSHCHWSYTVGKYRSFLMWPTREAIVEAMQDQGVDYEIVQVHADNCDCEVTDG